MEDLRLARWLAVIVLSLVCTSCIVIPLGPFTKSPFTSEILESLSEKDADRNQVRQLLGPPVVVKAKGEYWYYQYSHATWGSIAGTGSAVFNETEWLAVRFDKAGKVIFVERSDSGKCLSNGMCWDGTAPYVDDNYAKTYQPKADECAVYLVLAPLPWSFPTLDVEYSVDDKPIGRVNSKTYLFLVHPQGSIEISAYDLKITTHCGGCEKLYVQAVKKFDNSWLTGKILAPLDAAEGEKAISIRRNALPD